MKWDIRTHPENKSTVSWATGSTWVVGEKLSAMSVINRLYSNQIHSFATVDDGGTNAISRRWYLVITDLPDNALHGNRSVQATFYATDAADASVVDGSTFGEISVWEVSPATPDQIALVIDFTKVRSQNHQFGVNVLIAHGVAPSGAIADPKDESVTGKDIEIE